MGISSGSTTTKNTPYDPAAIKAGSTALTNAYGATQGTINQWSPALTAAIQRISDNITTPPQYMTDASRQLDDTINGKYLDPNSNPAASGMAKLIGDQTAGEYAATYGGSGRAHGGMAALLSSRGVGDALNNFYGNVYQAERGRQQEATMGAPAFHAGEYTDINALFPAVQSTAGLPLNAAATYAGGLGSLIAPYSTQTTTQKQPWGPQLLGAAAMIGGAAMGPGGLSKLIGGGGGLGGLDGTGATSAYGALGVPPMWGFGG